MLRDDRDPSAENLENSGATTTTTTCGVQHTGAAQGVEGIDDAIADSRPGSRDGGGGRALRLGHDRNDVVSERRRRRYDNKKTK